MRYFIFIVVTIFFLVGCSDDDNPTNPQPARYTLTGQVQNQFGEPATSLYIVVTDADNKVDSVQTNMDGLYEILAIRSGPITVMFRSTEVIVAGVKRYLDADTLINLNQNDVLNFTVREFHTIFHDNGTQTTQWNLYGGANNNGARYYFEDALLQDDHMTMKLSYLVPSDAQTPGMFITGQAAPADSGLIKVHFYRNGEDTGLEARLCYTTNQLCYSISLEPIPNLLGNSISLDVSFWTWFDDVSYPAEIVYVDDIWIFSY